MAAIYRWCIAHQSLVMPRKMPLWMLLFFVELLPLCSGTSETQHLTAWSLVHSRSGIPKHRVSRNSPEPELRITSMQMTSKVNSRFAQTVIHSEMRNPSSDSNSMATFMVYLPETAFISNFTMVIDGDLQVARVKSKEEAQKDFDEARKKNKTAGQVSAKHPSEIEQVQGMEAFEVSVTVRPSSFVQFQLTYQQLLNRRLHWFEQRLSIRPRQEVEHLSVQVLMYEPQGIARLMVVEPGASVGTDHQYTRVDHEEGGEVASIKYEPILEPGQVVDGDMVIRYDVQHSYSAGLVQIEDDYLVQYISPEAESLQPLPKNIVFVIDISGSMSGNKMAQTREAVSTILGELREFDSFMMILFDDSLEYWPPERKALVPASSSSVRKAQNYAQDQLVASGSTNINDALVAAANKLDNSEQYGSNLIVFLTDGQPTAGVTEPGSIIQNVISAAGDEVSIFSLGFGDEYELDFDLLKALSYRTGGFARRIIPGTDTAFQLTDFFLELNTPLLYNVRIVYPEDVMDKQAVTKTQFRQYFSGSELVVVGKLLEDAPSSWEARVEAESFNSVELVEQVNAHTGMVISEAAAVAYEPGFVYKLFVYWKIKNLLQEELMTDSEVEKAEILNFALTLAVENQLVTPLTSMIIVQKTKGGGDIIETDIADPNSPIGGNVYLMDAAPSHSGTPSVSALSGSLLAFAILSLAAL